MCIFFYQLRKGLLYYKKSTIYKISALLGFLLILRPINGICVFLIFFLADDFENLKVFFKKLFKNYIDIIIGSMIILGIISIQLILYYIQTGVFLLKSYKGYESSFLHPFMCKVLFSYRKGMFIYTPIIFFSFLGILTFYKNLYKLITLSIFFIFIVYVISAWKIWHNADSYGMRKFIEYYGIFALSLGFFIQFIKKYKFLKVFIYFIFSILIIHNFIQIHQYRKYIIHHNSMDKLKYWEVFWKTGDRYRGIHYRDRLKNHEIQDSISIISGFKTLDIKYNSLLDTNVFYSEPTSLKLNNKLTKFIMIEEELQDAIIQKNPTFIKLSFQVYPEEYLVFNNNPTIILTIYDEKNTLFYSCIKLKDYIYKKDQWQNIKFTRKINGLTKNCKLNIRFNGDNFNIYFDDLSFKLLITKN
jgi:hypothetical protein